MRINQVTIIASMIIFFLSCNPAKNLVKHSYNYQVVRMPGTIAVDGGGRPLSKGPDTLNLVFVEIPDKTVNWDYAWKGAKGFDVKAVPVTESKMDLGVNKQTGERVILQSSLGNKLYQLVLSPSDQQLSWPLKMSEGEIWIQGKYKNKTFKKNLGQQIELAQPDAM